MKALGWIVKILAVLAAVAAVVFLAIAYKDKIAELFNKVCGLARDKALDTKEKAVAAKEKALEKLPFKRYSCEDLEDLEDFEDFEDFVVAE